MSNNLIVEVEQGKLQGKTKKDFTGKTYCSFQGIPYAEPPLGELRFRAPQPPKNWNGILDATQEPKSCFMKDDVHDIYGGSEDCLFLNVYTPKLPQDGDDSPDRPVMFWIHGGAFTSGSSSSKLYGPEFLMPQDIVVITINYRLGVFGFLAFDYEDQGVTGNTGLKDMVMALKWVNKNISKFGGNPENVTIAGGSSGAASVHLLVLSPVTKGLFHKAILQSGSAINPWAYGLDGSIELCEKLGVDDTVELLDELRKKTTEELFKLGQELIDRPMDVQMLRIFGPVVESPFAEDAFLTQKPIELMRSGNYNHVPLLMGYNDLEGTFLDVLSKPKDSRTKNPKPEDSKTKKPKPKNRDEEFIPEHLKIEYLLPEHLRIEESEGSTTEESNSSITDESNSSSTEEYNSSKVVPHTLKLSPACKEHIIASDKIEAFYRSLNSSTATYDLLTDNLFARDVIFSAEIHATTSDVPIYFYIMSIETELNVYKKMSKVMYPGTCHGDEIFYLFKSEYAPEIEKNSDEERAMQQITLLWTNFMKHSNPNGERFNREWFWRPFKKLEKNYVNIGNNTKGKILTSFLNPGGKRFNFWRELFSTCSFSH